MRPLAGKMCLFVMCAAAWSAGWIGRRFAIRSDVHRMSAAEGIKCRGS